MENDKNLEKQADALKEEELDRVAGGMRTSGNWNPYCPKCNSEMKVYANNLARCTKCGYEYEVWSLITVNNKG